MHGNQRRVLHVDDDPQILRLVAQRLNQNGYEVISIQEPDRAISTLLDCDCRVVLLDIDMPDISGLELLKRIKSHDGGLQVIMLTSLVSMSTVLESMRWGAEACIFKPLTDFSPLLDAMQASFAKVDRWWDALKDLSQRKHQMA